MVNENRNKLNDAKNKLAEVYESEVSDDKYDNGNLDNINNAIKQTQLAIKELIAREEV